MRVLDLDGLQLFVGDHDSGSDEMCLLEAAAYLAGEEWSDRPECVCTVLGAFGRSLNDRLPDDKRQALVPLLPELLGTRGDGHAQARAYMAVDWAVHTVLPAFLALTDRIDAAAVARVTELAPVTDVASAQAAEVVVREIRDKAYSARSAALAALRTKFPAADAAAADAAAYAAAAAAAAYAAAAADAAYAAAAAARRAATEALAPTVARIQDSAIELFTRMVRIGTSPAAE